MERSVGGGKRTMVFFCEPNRSDEKGHCESNHRLVRYCIPKGTSMEPYMQTDITRMVNHVNSFRRKSLFGKAPYDLAMAALPADFFPLLGLERVPDGDVVLSPSVFSITSK